MDKLESESMGSELINCQPSAIDKSNQSAEYVQEIGCITSKNGISSQSSSVEDIPQENDIEKEVSFLDRNGWKDSTVSVQQPILTCKKGRTEQKPLQRRNQNIHCCEHCDKKFSNKQRLAVHRAKLHGVMDTGTSFTCCEICGTVFWSEEALTRHLSRHNTKEHKHNCSYCNRSFTSKAMLDRHERTHTKNYKFKCRFCSKGSVSKNVILVHEAQKHNHVSMGTIFYSCSFCGSNFPALSELENHESTHRDDPSIKCEHCDKMFKTVQRMRYHLNNHCLNKPKLCGRKESKNQEHDDLQKTEKPQREPSQQEDYLAEKTEADALLESLATEEIHIKDELTESDALDNESVERDTVEVDIGDKDYRNDVAVEVENQMTVSSNPATGPSKAQLEKLKFLQHQRVSDGIKSVLKKQKKNCCDICGKNFSYWPRLLFHRVRVHGIEDKDSPVSRCVCEICGKLYFNQEDLARHRSTHEKKNEDKLKYPCSHCDRSFVKKQQKDHHELTHTKNYRFKCRFCSKGASYQKAILLHEAQKHKHVSEKQIFYRCSVCCKDFLCPSSLKIHELCHSNEYSIKCENCDTMFKSNKQMKLHLRTCLLASSSNAARRRSKRRRPSDLKTSSNHHLQEVSLEQLTTEEIHIVDHGTKNDLIDRDTVEADIIEQDSRNGVVVGDNDLMPAQSNHEKCLPQSLSEDGIQQILLPNSKNNGIKKNDVSNQVLASTDGDKRKERKKYSCDDCDQIFVDRQRLYQHRVKVHDIFDKDVTLTRCKCEICGKVYFSEDALEYHRSAHKKTDESKFNHPCSYCDRKFKSNCRRKSHEQTHTKNYKFKCRFCDQGAAYKRTILLHEAQQHNVVSEKVTLYPCSTCGKKCTSSLELARHESSHSKDRPVKCEQCDIRFKNVVYMKQHLLFEHLSKLRIRKRKGINENNITDLQLAGRSPVEPMQHETGMSDVTSKITYKFSSGKTLAFALQISES